MAALPSGTVTLLFTDIEGSTQILRRLGERYDGAIAAYKRMVRAACAEAGGQEIDSQGDAFFVAFSRAADAVAAAMAVHRAEAAHSLPDGITIKTRIGLHTGEPRVTPTGYVGLDVHRGARLCAAGHGGQLLVSASTRNLIAHDLPPGVRIRDLGLHRLRDIEQLEQIYQLVVDGLPSDFPPLRTLDARPNNLPLQATPLIGRDREIASASALLRRGDTRLLTFTGPGGTGKTRLALQVGAELLGEFADGVYFVELDRISDPTLVASTIAHTLGIKEAGGQPLLESLKAELRARQALLVLDNFEQVATAAPLLADLLRAAPRLKFLVTSRIVLHLYGEHEFPVPPLALADPKHLPPLARLNQYAAVALFIQRAQAVKPDFVVTNESAPAVAEICARLDGLPLAIELAAARVKLLAPQALLPRLENRLKLLTGGARDLTARQQTLRGAIDWSYNLLHDQEQALFARLGVFAGGCKLEMVEVVCNATGDLDVDPLDGLASLVDKSLLRQEDGIDGEPRFSMLDTLREYALDRLAARGEATAIRNAHLAFMRRFARQAVAEQAFDLLEVEDDNLKAALAWALQGGQYEDGIGLAASLWPFWQRRGSFTEGRRWLERMAEAGRDGPPALRAQALLQAGQAAAFQGDHVHAMEPIEASIQLLQAIGDTNGVASAMITLGTTLRDRGDYPRAVVVLEVALELHRMGGDQLGVAIATNRLGCIARNLHDFSQARRLLEESLRLYRELRHDEGIARALHDLGETAQIEGDTAGAMALYQRSVPLFQELSIKIMLAWSLHNQGFLLHYREDDTQALRRFRESLALFRELGTKDGTAACLEGIARVAVAGGDLQRAMRLMGASAAIGETIGGIFTPVYLIEHEQTMAQLRERLDPAQQEALWTEGRAMTLEQAVALALEEDV